MTCEIMPWEHFLQLAILALFLVAIGVAILMYLDGYWTPERVYQRWLHGDSFAAIDARQQQRKYSTENILKRR